MSNDVTMKRRLSLAEPIPRMCQYGLCIMQLWRSSYSDWLTFCLDDLIYRCLNKMTDILLSNYLIDKFIFWFEFHWRLFLKSQLTISQHWFWLRTCFVARSAPTRYLNQCWPSSLTPIYVIRLWWVKRLWILSQISFIVMIIFDKLRLFYFPHVTGTGDHATVGNLITWYGVLAIWYTIP